MTSSAESSAVPNQGFSDGIAVVAPDPFWSEPVLRAVRFLQPVIASVEVEDETESMAAWGYPAAILEKDGTISSINEAWRCSPAFVSRASGLFVNHSEVLEKSASSAHPQAALAARLVHEGLERAHLLNEPCELVGYACEEPYGFYAACIRSLPRGRTWLSHVPLGPYLARADTAEGRFRETFNGMLEAVYWFAPLRNGRSEILDFVFLDMNAQGEQGCGRPVCEMVGRRLRFRPPGGGPDNFGRFREVYERGARLDFEFEVARSRDSEHFRVGAIRVGDELVVLTTNTTETVEARRRLGEIRRRHRLAEREAQVGIVELLKGRSRLVLDEAAAELLRVGEAESIAFEDAAQWVHAADFEGLQHHLQTGATGVRAFRTRGPKPLEERWLELHLFESGQAESGQLGAIRDVTDLVRAKNEAIHSRRLLEELVNGLPTGVVLADRCCRIRHFNVAAAEILGAHGDLMGQNLGQVFDFFEATRGGPGWQFVCEGRSFDRQIARRTVGAESKWLELSGRPLDNPEFVGLIVFSDVTERVEADEARARLEAHVQEVRKMEILGELASGVAHDFGNMLTAIASAAEYLVPSFEVQSEEAEAVRDILDATGRGRELVGQMTRLGRPTEGAGARVSLSKILNEAARWIHRKIPPEVDLEVSVRADTPSVWAAEGDLVRIFLNLARNAVDALPEERGVVRLAARRGTPQDAEELGVKVAAEVQVIDDGVGMDEVTRARVFQPFFTTKGMGVGMGIGLVAVKRTVMALGGLVRIESSVGQGTTMTVVLPGAAEDQAISTP